LAPNHKGDGATFTMVQKRLGLAFGGGIVARAVMNGGSEVNRPWWKSLRVFVG